MGVVKKTVFPLTWSICLISLVGRSWRLNQPAASGKGSSVARGGCGAARRRGSRGRPRSARGRRGRSASRRPDSSSRSTNWPALNPARAGHLDGVSALDRVGGQVGGRAAAVVPAGGADDDERDGLGPVAS